MVCRHIISKMESKQFVGGFATQALVDPFVDRFQNISDMIMLETAADDEITPLLH